MDLVSIGTGDAPVTLEVEWIAPERATRPLVVFLHEGLGSIGGWGDWPRRLCDRVGSRGLVFSRYGYGHSQARPAQQSWPMDYMEREARESLPALFEALGVDAARQPLIIFGHSDGATIALLYAAAFPQAVAATVVLAPHVFTEQVARERIAQLRDSWGDGRLRAHLARLHDDPDGVFDGWSQRWVSPEFQDWDISGDVAGISGPLLAMQGRQDQFGTLGQLDEIKRSVPHAELLVLENCRHVPHQEQPEQVLAAVEDFLSRLGLMAA